MEYYVGSFVRKCSSGKGWRKCLKFKDGDKWKTVSVKAKAKGKRAAQKEAEEWRQEMNAAREAEWKPKSVAGPKHGMSVSEYVRAYIQMRAVDVTNPIEPETVYDYERSLKDIANPDGGIANILLTELSYDDVLGWETWMLSSDGKGLAVTTATKRHTLLKAALTQAVADKRIPHNPMEGLKRPRKKKAREINALMPDSMAKVRYWINTSEPTPFVTAVALAFCVGMRRQECAALKWEDVDFANGFLRVRRAIGRSRAGERVKDLKNHESRVVPLTEPLRDVLTRRLTKVRSDLASLGAESMLKDLYVCGEIDGTFGRMWSYTRQWKMLREILGLEGVWRKEVVFHDLRHSFATYAINSKNMDVVTVARILGHSDTSVTLNWYSTALPSAIIDAAPAITSALDVGNLELPQYILPGEG